MDEIMSEHPDGATLRLRVVPRASATGFAGRHGAALKLRVSAAPVEGAANDEVRRYLARVTGVRRSDVSILSGTRGRDKAVLIRGVTADALGRLLSEALGSPEGR